MGLLVPAAVLAASCAPLTAGPPAREAASPPAGATAAPPAQEAVRFTVVGDFGTGGPEEREVAATMRNWEIRNPIDAFVTTGDNVYPKGKPSAFRAAWLQPFGWVDREGISLVASLGNHDIETDGGGPVMDLLSMPAPWYRSRIGPVEFFVLDANRPGDEEQLAFLREALSTSDAPWKVAVFHQPPYSCGRYTGTSDLRALWVPVLKEGGVDLVLNGHDHGYQRFAPIDDITYVVTGGGGASLYGPDPCAAGTPEPVVALRRHHFLAIEATTTRLRLSAVLAPEGTVADSVTLSAR